MTSFVEGVKHTDECFWDGVLNRVGGRGRALGRERDRRLRDRRRDAYGDTAMARIILPGLKPRRRTAGSA
jgi:hypothetical protein